MQYSGIRKWRNGDADGCSLRQWVNGEMYELVFMISHAQLRATENPRQLFAKQIREARSKIRAAIAADVA